jgi:23S rRNA pseudouridine2604 synthase
MQETSLLRLSKLMADRGLCSRREADELIERGWVKVNGQIVDQLGTKVASSAKIDLSPQAQSQLSSAVTILLNKPIGYVSGQPEKDYVPAVRLIVAENRDPSDRAPGRLAPASFFGLAPAGRLDIDSQGLLIFTQNGAIAKRLIGERGDVEKEYLVRVRGALSPAGLKLLGFGLSLDGAPLRPARVDRINEDQLRFVLKEGKKRQVRRMCEAVGLEVAGLKRVRVGHVRLGTLPEGKWRFLAPGERF